MIDRCPNCRERVFFTNSVCPSCGKDRDLADPITENLPEKAPDSEPSPQSRAAFWGALALAVLTVWSFAADWSMVSQSGSIDYRNRVTGLRLLAAGEDPYHYKWTIGKPERFCDLYENPALPTTKTTVSPTSLLAAWPWALLPYPLAKTAWLLAQWVLLAGLWFVWFRWPGHTGRSRWWWTVLVVGFTYTLAWRHHIDRGQSYILWAFLLGVWMRLSLGKTAARHGFWAGLLTGALICLRPPLLLVIAPFLVLRRRGQWLGALVGVLLGLGIPAMISPTVWKDYGRAMETWSQVYRTHTEPRPGPRALPPKIEGMPLELLARYKVVQYVDSSLFRVGRAFGLLGIPAPAMLAALAALFGVWLWFARRAGDGAFMLGLAAWSFLLDAFLPAYRNPYNDVMILNAIALISVIGRTRGVSYGIAIFALLTGAFMSVHLPAQPWPLYLPTLVLVALALLALRQSAAKTLNAPSPC